MNRYKMALLAPVLILGMTLAAPRPVHAQTSFQVTLGSRPHWNHVRGTRVMEVRAGERPDYDMFRYGNSYYVYNNDRWYTSRRWNGDYSYVDTRSVPVDFRRVPKEHWHSYPTDWDHDGDRH